MKILKKRIVKCFVFEVDIYKYKPKNRSKVE